MELPHHGRYDYTPIVSRSDYTWPEGKRLALYFGVNVEHFAYGQGLRHTVSRLGPQPDQRNFCWSDYGNRVGFWRLLDVFDSVGLPLCHLVNSAVLSYAPEIGRAILDRGDEFVAHGRTNSERQGDLWEDDEAHLIASVRDAIGDIAGTAPRGWMGPWMSQSGSTPDLLRDAGFRFLMDWPFDDQPIWMTTTNGRMLSIPYSLEVNDSTLAIVRGQTGREYAQSVMDQFDELLERSADQPLVCGLGVHPSMVGQPHRLRPFREAMKYIAEHTDRSRVWFTRPGEIFDHIVAEDGSRPG